MSEKIKEAIDNLAADLCQLPQVTTSAFQATAYSDGCCFTTYAKIRNFIVPMDEQRGLGGDNCAPNPVEMVLAAFGSSQAIVYQAFAVVLGMEVQRIEVNVKGYLDPRGFLNLADVPAGYSNVTFTTLIVSPEPPERIRQLADLVQKHCPVNDTLRRPVRVKGKVELLEPGASPGDVLLVFETHE